MVYITVIGSLHMDLVVRTHRVPKPGETLAGIDFHLISGGSCMPRWRRNAHGQLYRSGCGRAGYARFIKAGRGGCQ